ncbi:cyclic nucleotide-binding domain-containing protein [Nocardioides ultimimeridianus]
MREHQDDYRLAPRDWRLAGLKLPSGKPRKLSRADERAFVAALQDCPRLAGFGERELRRLAQHCVWFAYPARWTMIAQSSRSTHCYLLTQGSVTFRRDGVEVGGAATGDFVALHALVDRAAPTSVVTADRVRGVAVPAEDLRAILDVADRRTAVTDRSRALSPIEDVLGQAF